MFRTFLKIVQELHHHHEYMSLRAIYPVVTYSCTHKQTAYIENERNFSPETGQILSANVLASTFPAAGKAPLLRTVYQVWFTAKHVI